MTKLELIELIRNDMLDAVKQRDELLKSSPTEDDYKYFNGQYRAYNNVIRLLMMFDIEELRAIDSRLIYE